ncbi:MAG TPA: hypothetical protein VNO52_09670, partial [Methylomirabilota bacterium]|nr:hypothetical protein [Methylomirabilota bacterium]
TCECERSNETTLNQAFQLISGPSLHQLLTASHNRLGEMAARSGPAAQLVEELFWETLGRAPTSQETARSLAVLGASPDRRAGLEDVAWALLNAKEFVLRQ